MAKKTCSYYVIDRRGVRDDQDFRSIAAAKRAAKALTSATVVRECRPKGRAGTLKRTRVLTCFKKTCRRSSVALNTEHTLRKPARRRRRK